MVRALRARQDPARSEPRGPQQTHRGQRPVGQSRPSEVKGPGWPIRPSEVRALRARQDPARSEPRGPNKAQRGQRPSEVRALRVCEEETRTCATARRPVCQPASVPRNPTFPCLFSQAAGVTFQLPREGRRACLSVVCSLLLLSSVVFPCWFLGCCPEAGGCAVATPAI